jgi:hypothetical protein
MFTAPCLESTQQIRLGSMQRFSLRELTGENSAGKSARLDRGGAKARGAAEPLAVGAIEPDEGVA